MPINLNANSTQQLQELASMAYGHGSTKAGAGNIGMIGGHVVKFNTHFGERLFASGTKAEKQASCDALRPTLAICEGHLRRSDQREDDGDSQGARAQL